MRLLSRVLAAFVSVATLASGPVAVGVSDAEAVATATSGDQPIKVDGRPQPAEPSWHAASDTSDPAWDAPVPVAWPESGTADVDVPATGLVRAGSLPVWIGAPTSGEAPHRVAVTLHDQAAATAVGVVLLVSVRRADGGLTPATAKVAVDYVGFRQAYGADFANRLQLMALPSCALTTPVTAGCAAPEIVTGVNDVPLGRMAADVVVPPREAGEVAEPSTSPSTLVPSGVYATASPTSEPSVDADEPTSDGSSVASDESPLPSVTPTVKATLPAPVDSSAPDDHELADDGEEVPADDMAATVSSDYGTYGLGAGTASQTGDYAATPLSSTAKWGVSHNTGGFSWSYPIPMPPAPAGATPSLAITYSSQEVDGRTARQNGQVSQVGEGFSFSPMFIERKFQPCTDDGQSTQDLCEKSPEYYLSWNGRASELVRKPGTNEWRLRDDPGWRVKSLTGANNGDQYQGDYWEVMTPDGTQHLFGYGREPVTNAVTNGAWNVPVFGDDLGEPCFSVTGFAASWCQRPWRWNLDRIVDTNDNVVSLFWTKETNHYARGGVATQATSYDRGGFLRRVDYGERNTRENWAAPAYVLVDTTHRCSTQVNCTDTTLNDPTLYPDVPLDLRCTGSPCSDPGEKAPSFWSTEKIARVSTWVKNNATTDPAQATYSDVDEVELFYSFPATGETAVTPSLFLRAIRRHGLVGTRVTLPDVLIGGTALSNRVDSNGTDKPATNKYRVTAIEDELGAASEIAYGQANPCTASSLPSWHSNGTDCFPQWFDPDGPGSAPLQEGAFRKYLVMSVDVDDTTVPLPQSPNQLSTYTYLGAPAWHYDNELHTPANKQSWSDWRGYETVREVRGDVAGASRSTTLFKAFRGMHGDKASPSGGTKTVTISDSENGSFNDENWLAGRTLETQRNSAAGSTLAKALYRHWSHKQYTGPTPSGGQSHDVYFVRESRSTEYQRNILPEPDLWRSRRIDTTFDSTYGVPTTIADLADTSGGGDDTCTAPTYAHNATKWIIGLPYVTRRYQGSCASPTQIGRTELNYDGQAYATAPVKGNPTTVKQLIDGANAAVTGTEYDLLGRVVAVTPPTEFPKAATQQAKTTTTYNPASGYPYSGVTTRSGVVNGNSGIVQSTTQFSFAWGVPWKITDDANGGALTEINRDALGRVVSAQRPQDPTNVPGLVYEYTVNQDAPSRVRTRTLLTGTTYVDSYTYPTSFGENAEIQTVSPAGGRIVTASRYDDQGRVVASTDPMWNSAAAGSGLLNINPASVPVERRTTYDSTSRATSVGTYASNTAEATTTTSYGGWSSTTDYPVRGDVTTDVDVLGRTVQITEANADVPLGAVRTHYTHTLTGLLDTITNDPGYVWDYDYDWLGRRTRSIDPDTGENRTTYDPNGDILTQRDAQLETISHVYDVLRRKTDTYTGSASTGTLLAHWTYDDTTVVNAQGRLTAATAYVGGATGAAYTTAVTGYDTSGRPTGKRWTIPAAAGTLAGTYTHTIDEYDPAGNVRKTTVPPVGGLPAETLISGYSDLGLPTTLTSSLDPGNPYIAATGYRADGRLQSRTLYGGVSRSFVYDDLNRLNWTFTYAPVAGFPEPIPIEDVTYGYDDESNVTWIADRQAGVGSDPQLECFRYDDLNRLRTGFTTSGLNCPAIPPNPPSTYGIDAYSVAYTYDTAGRVATATNGGVMSSYSYGDSAHRHAVTSVGATGYQYNANGATTQRGTQSLTWNTQHRLEAVTGTDASTFVYDADGARLLRTTGTTTTLYLDGMEVTASGSNVTAKRYYGSVTMRTTAGVTVLLRNRQDSTAVAYNPATDSATYQRYTPFGARRGATLAATDRRFLDKTEDATGLIAMGARYYDPTIGAFTAPDPLMAVQQSATLPAYGYANNNPATLADPTGLSPGCTDEQLNCEARQNKYVQRQQRATARAHREMPPPSCDAACEAEFELWWKRIQRLGSRVYGSHGSTMPDWQQHLAVIGANLSGSANPDPWGNLVIDVVTGRPASALAGVVKGVLGGAVKLVNMVGNINAVLDGVGGDYKSLLPGVTLYSDATLSYIPDGSLPSFSRTQLYVTPQHIDHSNKRIIERASSDNGIIDLTPRLADLADAAAYFGYDFQIHVGDGSVMSQDLKMLMNGYQFGFAPTIPATL